MEASTRPLVILVEAVEAVDAIVLQDLLLVISEVQAC